MHSLRLLRNLQIQCLQQKSLFKTMPVNYSIQQQHPMKFLETQERWRKSDNVSQRYQLIYKAPMEPWVNLLSTYLTFSTGTLACASAYYAAMIYDKTNWDSPVLIGEDIVIAESATEYFVYLGAFIAFHVAVKILLSKYVVRMYQDGDQYIAIFRGHTYNAIKKHQFNLKDFKKLTPTFVVSWGDARFSLGNKHAIILDNYFKTPEYFNYLLNKKIAEKPTDD